MRPTAPPAAPGARGPPTARPAHRRTGAQYRSAPPRRCGGGAAPPAARARGSAAPAGAHRAQPRGSAPLRAAAARRTWGRGAPPAPAAAADRVWKWTDEDFAKRRPGQMPMGKATDEWVFGNVEEGFKKADLVLDETFMTQSTGHQPLETRTAMAYWQNGKLFCTARRRAPCRRSRRSRAGPG
jgi:hypothetical protein